MSRLFRPYVPRHISFSGVASVGDWRVKVSRISMNARFQALASEKEVLLQLPTLLQTAVDHYGIAFLIVHEGSDGIWSLANWWTGMEMLRTTTLCSPFENPTQVTVTPERGSMACTWELKVIAHERDSWVRHVLNKHGEPAFDDYLSDTISGIC